jgi:hypothetical protein
VDAKIAMTDLKVTELSQIFKHAVDETRLGCQALASLSGAG